MKPARTKRPRGNSTRPRFPRISAEESIDSPADLKPTLVAENRRKHVRTKVNFKGCIRSFAHGDDIVACEDISRAGLRFRTRKHYSVKSDIEVAAPYSPGSLNIFVRGQIVHVEQVPGRSTSAAASPTENPDGF